MIEAMQKRHMVRKYTDKSLSLKTVEKLNARVMENNKKYNLAIKLMTNDTGAFNAVTKLILPKE